MPVDTATGVITGEGPDAGPSAEIEHTRDPRRLPEAVTLAEASNQIHTLTSWLGLNSRDRKRLREELAPVNRMYQAVYDSALLTSAEPEAKLREAEARQACRAARMPGDDMSLEERRDTLKLQLKTADAAGHDVRAALVALAVTSNNLRTEATMFGTGERNGR
jgi:hypothetical protein